MFASISFRNGANRVAQQINEFRVHESVLVQVIEEWVASCAIANANSAVRRERCFFSSTKTLRVLVAFVGLGVLAAVACPRLVYLGRRESVGTADMEPAEGFEPPTL